MSKIADNFEEGSRANKRAEAGSDWIKLRRALNDKDLPDTWPLYLAIEAAGMVRPVAN